MLTDTRRVELGLPIIVALDVLLNGVEDRDDDYSTTQSALHDAIDEIFVVETRERTTKLIRRLERVHAEVFAPCMAEGSQVAKTGLVLYHFLRVLTDSDYLVIPDGSAFRRALDLLLPALQGAADEEKLNASAEKQARRVLRELQAKGYYWGVEVTV